MRALKPGALSSYLLDPPGPVVTITPIVGGFRVDPPPAAGELSHTFFSKSEAFAHARELWTEHRCGLSDLTDNMNNRR